MNCSANASQTSTGSHISATTEPINMSMVLQWTRLVSGTDCVDFRADWVAGRSERLKFAGTGLVPRFPRKKLSVQMPAMTFFSELASRSLICLDRPCRTRRIHYHLDHACSLQKSKTIVAMHTSDSLNIVVVDGSSSTIAQHSPSFTIIGSQTLWPGSIITISGVTVSDVGGYVWYGLGGLPASTSAVSSANGGSGIGSVSRSSNALQQTASGALPILGCSSGNFLIAMEAFVLLVGLVNTVALQLTVYCWWSILKSCGS